MSREGQTQIWDQQLQKLFRNLLNKIFTEQNCYLFLRINNYLFFKAIKYTKVWDFFWDSVAKIEKCIYIYILKSVNLAMVFGDLQIYNQKKY